jgi:hypothetical protein
MRHLKNFLTLFAFALVLTGCAGLGNEPAQTFNQKLAYAYGTHTAILQAATSSLEAGTISAANASDILKQADNAKLVLDTARQAFDAGDSAGANSKLAVAVTALGALQDYLRAHGSKP